MSRRLPREASDAPEERGERSLAGWLALASAAICLLLLASQSARAGDCPNASSRPEVGAPWTAGVVAPRLLPTLV